MEISSANGAGGNANQQLFGVRSRAGNIAQLQQFLWRIQDHRAHERNYVQEEQERSRFIRDPGLAVIERRYSKRGGLADGNLARK